MNPLARFACLALAAAATAAFAAPSPSKPAPVPFKVGFIRLISSDADVAARTDADELSATVASIEAVAADWSKSVSGGDACIVYVGIRPGHNFRTWSACEKADARGLDDALAAGVRAAQVATVSEGTVLFSVNGAAPWCKEMTASQWPSAWTASAPAEAADVEAIVDRVWTR